MEHWEWALLTIKSSSLPLSLYLFLIPTPPSLLSLSSLYLLPHADDHAYVALHSLGVCWPLWAETPHPVQLSEEVLSLWVDVGVLRTLLMSFSKLSLLICV